MDFYQIKNSYKAFEIAVNTAMKNEDRGYARDIFRFLSKEIINDELLKSNNEELINGYKLLASKVRALAFPNLLTQEVPAVFKRDIAHVLYRDLEDLKEDVDFYFLRFIDDSQIETQQRLLVNNLLENTQRLTEESIITDDQRKIMPSIGNWIKYYYKKVGGGADVSRIKIAEFFSGDSNIKKLDEKELVKVKNLISLQDYLRRPVEEIKLMQDEFLVDLGDGRLGLFTQGDVLILDDEEFEQPKESQSPKSKVEKDEEQKPIKELTPVSSSVEDDLAQISKVKQSLPLEPAGSKNKISKIEEKLEKKDWKKTVTSHESPVTSSLKPLGKKEMKPPVKKIKPAESPKTLPVAKPITSEIKKFEPIKPMTKIKKAPIVKKTIGSEAKPQAQARREDTKNNHPAQGGHGESPVTQPQAGSASHEKEEKSKFPKVDTTKFNIKKKKEIKEPKQMPKPEKGLGLGVPITRQKSETGPLEEKVADFYKKNKKDEEDVAKQEKQYEKEVGNDRNKAVELMDDLLQTADSVKIRALLRIIAGQNSFLELFALPSVNSMINQYISKHEPKKQAKLKDASNKKVLIPEFLKAVLEDKLGMTENESARIGIHLGNMAYEKTKDDQFLKMAYFDAEKNLFIWNT